MNPHRSAKWLRRDGSKLIWHWPASCVHFHLRRYGWSRAVPWAAYGHVHYPCTLGQFRRAAQSQIVPWRFGYTNLILASTISLCLASLCTAQQVAQGTTTWCWHQQGYQPNYHVTRTTCDWYPALFSRKWPSNTFRLSNNVSTMLTMDCRRTLDLYKSSGCGNLPVYKANAETWRIYIVRWVWS